MIIEKPGNKLIIKLEDSDVGKTWQDLTEDDVFFYADLEWHVSSVDLWEYIYDANRDLVFRVNGYGWNKIDELFENYEVEMEGLPNTKEDWGPGENGDELVYEWNEGREW